MPPQDKGKGNKGKGLRSQTGTKIKFGDDDAVPATTPVKEAKGQKRDRDGKPKDDKEKEKKEFVPREKHESVIQQQSDAPVRKGPLTKKDILLREILELGGSKEDLDLLDGVDESDEENAAPKEKKEKKEKPSANQEANLLAELAMFSKELGLASNEKEVPQKFEKEIVVEDDWVDEEGMEEEEEEEEIIMPTDQVLQTGKFGKALFQPQPEWHTYPLPILTPPTQSLPQRTLDTLYEKAKGLLQTENETYSNSASKSSSDRQFLATVMKSGTLNDKVSALTLVIQESPLHATRTLDTLLGMSRKRSRNEAVQSVGALKDLLTGTVLPDRKLRFFKQQPELGAEGMTDRHLVVWAFEDYLKRWYFDLLQVMEQLSMDQLPFARNHMVTYLFELLRDKPEQEQNLLRLLVNKLGDTDRKVASKTSYNVLQLEQSHPFMKSIVIREIEQLVFKPSVPQHALYYAMITLNQTILATRDTEVANRLIDVYFAFFTKLLQTSKPVQKPAAKKGEKLSKKAQKKLDEEEKAMLQAEETNAKMISAVLTGVNRAFPFSKVDDDVFEKHLDTLFRITHTGNFNTSIQALLLIFQVINAKQLVSDRFYRTLYESLLDHRLITSSKQAMYLNLLFKALKADGNVPRVKAFVKRMVQTTSLHQPSFICGMLYLLSELEIAMPTVRGMLRNPEMNDDDEEEVFRDAPDDDDEEEEKAVVSTEQKKEVASANGYDGRKRDPQFANADGSCLWELSPLLTHFHPTVCMYASAFLAGGKMPSKPDLALHTLGHFLDRFVYRNAKAKPAARGGSIMQPLAGGDTRGMVLATKAAAETEQPVNSEAFWRKKVEQVPVDEIFFHKYFTERNARAGVTSKKDKKRKAAGSDVESEMDDEEVWDALVDSNPQLEGGSDLEDDLDDDDLEDLEGAMGSDEEIDDEELARREAFGDEGMLDEDDDDLLDDEAEEVEAEDLEDLEDDDREFGVEDEDDLMDDEDVVLDAPEEEEEELDAEEAKRKAKKDERKAKRRKLKELPVFASADDYAQYLQD
ncbi:RNA-binding ribosome biosynthesis protein mak21 [Saitoella coloradoensis]